MSKINFMKNQTRYIAKLIVCVVTPFLMGSCADDFFDKNPLDAVSDNTFWKTRGDAELALTGCYHAGSGWDGENFWLPRGLLYLDLMAGNGSEKELIPDRVTDGTLTSAYWVTEGYWRSAYAQITACNNFLEKIGNVEMDEEEKQVMISEVRTLRAYYYMNLAIFFGDVPLVTQLLTIAEANSVFQAPRNEVFDFVEKELKESAEILPPTRPDSENGRITAGAALAILGRAQLFNKKWEDAKNTYRKIMDAGAYQIAPEYSELFWERGEFSKEIILSSQFQQDTYSHVLLQYLYPETWGGWHQFSPYNELVKAYECIDGKTTEESPLFDPDNPYDNRDPRLDYTIMISDRTVFKGVTYVSRPDSNSPDRFNKYNWSGYCINKFMDPDFDANLMNYGGNWSIIRYPEVLLGYLEAHLESGGAIDQGILDQTVNLVRQRSSVQMPAVTTTNPAELREIIRRERRVEFAFEGLRYFDILRWGIAAEELNRQFTGMKLTNDPDNYTAFDVDDEGYLLYQRRNFKEGINELWPIPLSEREINTHLNQNTGYQQR
ncbi:Starch-binding associating with outer membrane [Sinomicrobium oceani]|uniref:Starch-binding associating with outer membrane n=2 Tax=Sinomicrobium oceani TaxID=1150368 RepID=A0A1K1RHN8_9FLAO|nr:Starch-binding associating with outer membrane [Sinomicrobium oceani]